jgi:hypothetical protein
VTARALCLAVALIAGCGNDSSGPDFSGVSPADLLPVELGLVDLATVTDIGNLFCTQSCPSPMVCCIPPTGQGMCTAASDCPDGGVVAGCTSAAECPGTLPVCCVSITYSMAPLDAGTQADTANSQCTSTAMCAGGLDIPNSTFHTILCTKTADCAGYMGNYPSPPPTAFDACCSSPRAPSVHYCIPSSAAAQGGFTCL